MNLDAVFTIIAVITFSWIFYGYGYRRGEADAHKIRNKLSKMPGYVDYIEQTRK